MIHVEFPRDREIEMNMENSFLQLEEGMYGEGGGGVHPRLLSEIMVGENEDIIISSCFPSLLCRLLVSRAG